MRVLACLAIATLAYASSIGGELSSDQQLSDACFRLNQYRVVRLLRSGANVNATFGTNTMPEDGVLLKPATPKIRADWTPLIALAESSRTAVADDRKNMNDSEKRIAILRILLSHGCNVDDASGTQAIWVAIETGSTDFVKLQSLFRSPSVPKHPWDYLPRVLDFLNTHNRLPTMQEQRKELGIPQLVD